MSDYGSFHRKAFIGTLSVTAVILFGGLLLYGVGAPSFAQGFARWVGAHWTVFVWIIVAVVIVDFVSAFDRSKAEVEKRLEALEQRVAGRDVGPRDLEHKS